ncbi:MAG: uracil phosphoribosyltransferase [Planctomycetota bacterium]
MSQVNHVQHPLVHHHLCTLRNKSTPPAGFRVAVEQLTTLIAVHATRDLDTQPVTIPTPLTDAPCQRITTNAGLVPILRAGLGMVHPMLSLMPDASVWHLGLYRNEETAEPVGYYDKLHDDRAPKVAFVLDPMLATGGSITMALQRVREWGVDSIRVLSLIASQQGIDRVTAEYPDVPLFVAAIDPVLNAQSYIVPGLGDAGDRIFDTPQQGET